MAWTDQCKYAFCANAQGILDHRNGRGITKILRELSKDSGIPYETLKRWWYEKYPKEDFVKNDKNFDSQNISTASTETMTNHDQHPMCPVCGVNKVQRNKREDGSWYYRNKCHKCRTIPTPKYQSEGDVEITCPYCEKTFNLKQGDMKWIERS